MVRAVVSYIGVTAGIHIDAVAQERVGWEGGRGILINLGYNLTK